MPISKALLQDITYQFYAGSGHNDLKVEREDTFWDWFQKTATYYPINNDYKVEQKDKDILEGNCFGNSQSNAVSNNKEYYEGFVKIKAEWILHAFNVNEERKVEDITVKNNEENFIKKYDNLNYDYYGINIPRDYLNENLPTDIKDSFLNKTALIYNFYTSLINKENNTKLDKKE